jgi:endoglucanase Acf2
MIDLLVRDIATHTRYDPQFPFLRNFDLYAGHSWATGRQQFTDGANSESSSEAIAAWAAVLLWGEIKGNRGLRDFGAFLFATEIAAAEEYWFDVYGENFPPDYDLAMVGQVWGGKSSYSTWWTDDPEPMRGISFLPLTRPRSTWVGGRNMCARISPTCDVFAIPGPTGRTFSGVMRRLPTQPTLSSSWWPREPSIPKGTVRVARIR